MAESSNYECAAEIREAIATLSGHVEDLVNAVNGRNGAAPDRRDQWAGQLFAVLVREEAERLSDHWPSDDRYGRLAAVAWRLADQLHASDPRRAEELRRRSE